VLVPSYSGIPASPRHRPGFLGPIPLRCDSLLFVALAPRLGLRRALLHILLGGPHLLDRLSLCRRGSSVRTPLSRVRRGCDKDRTNLSRFCCPFGILFLRSCEAPADLKRIPVAQPGVWHRIELSAARRWWSVRHYYYDYKAESTWYACAFVTFPFAFARMSFKKACFFSMAASSSSKLMHNSRVVSVSGSLKTRTSCWASVGSGSYDDKPLDCVCGIRRKCHRFDSPALYWRRPFHLR